MKMKQKIYWNICIMALVSMVLGTLVTAWLLCRDLQQQMRRSTAQEIRYLQAAMNVSGADFLDTLSSRGDGNRENRITWVAQDGAVLYDSYAQNAEELENHADRPEISQALKTGWGQSTRLSDTLAERTYYCAAKLKDGSVIRVASTTKSNFAAFVNTIPMMLFMSVAIFALTLVLALRQTTKIVQPINDLNLDDPKSSQPYEEFSPLLRKLEMQNNTINQQMRLIWEKQEEFTTITENMQEGFILVDRHADVLSFNSSAVRILDINMMKENGQMMNVLDLNRSSSFRQVVDEALHGQHSEHEMELHGRFYQMIANPVTISSMSSEKAQGAVVVILDVTEKAQQEEMRREFTANVSHELKTPLTSISGYAEIMQNGLVKPEDMAPFAGKIYQEAQRLITLVNDIIRLSQLDEDTLIAERTAVDLYQLAQQVLERLSDPAEKAGVALELKGAPVTIDGVELILDEMLYNLCDNAIKYNHQGGHVSVTVGEKEKHPYIEVRDDGIGIPQKDQSRIFERFYRVDKSHSRKIGGTGLGLSIVKHAARHHRADIELKSTPGQGTTIKIVFGKKNLPQK